MVWWKEVDDDDDDDDGDETPLGLHSRESNRY